MSPAPSTECHRDEGRSSEDTTIAELFTQQAARTPEKAALIAGERRLTYRELDEHSNRLARHLRELGVWPGRLAGIAIERSELLATALLAVLKAGGAYVPLDLGYPRERLTELMEDAALPLVLTSAQAREKVPERAGTRIVDVGDSAIGFESAGEFAGGGGPTHLAYMIYTSGSTGRPKGVMVENRNVVSFFSGMDRAIGCEPGVWLAVTGISFDISVLELLWTLTRGFTVVLHGEERTTSIAGDIERHGVTHLQMTPSLARMLLLDGRTSPALRGLRQILLGGEAVPASLVRRLRQEFRGQLYNMYGPTETTVWSTTYAIGEVGNSVPIGKPIHRTEAVVLDENGHPTPDGAPGELYLGGEGVARGYWNQPELTAARFLTIPQVSSGRMYRTGDLARRLPDGNLEFLGRTDYQIKLRGHRIELGEIEAALEGCAGVQQAVVTAREDREGDQRLVAYMVAGSSPAPGTAALRAALASRLPDFMVPSAFVFLPALPLTENRKIDRKALLAMPPPDMGGSGRDLSGGGTEMEQRIARAWQEALGLSAVGLEDNFFDLGAHSLAVAEVHARLQEELGKEIALVDLFQHSTVRTLAAFLAGAPGRTPASDRAQRRRQARQL